MPAATLGSTVNVETLHHITGIAASSCKFRDGEKGKEAISSVATVPLDSSETKNGISHFAVCAQSGDDDDDEYLPYPNEPHDDDEDED